MPDAPLLTAPMSVFAYLSGVLALIFWLSGLKPLEKLFEIAPPVLYAYFIPTLSTTFGIIPQSSPVYSWMTTYLLPVALLLLMITVDLRAIARLGGMALLVPSAAIRGEWNVLLNPAHPYFSKIKFMPPEGFRLDARMFR